MVTVTIKQIQEVIDPKARWLAKDEDGTVSWFCDKPKLYGKAWAIIGFIGLLGKIEVAEFEGKDWTVCCVELEPDYSEWVGKLCAFWDDNEEDRAIGEFLGYTYDRGAIVFSMKFGGDYAHIRPVKPDEVEFVK